MIWILGLLACGEKTEDSGVVTSAPVDATLRLLDVESGSPIPNILVASGDTSETTTDDGRATVSVDSNDMYTLRASDDSAMDHLYQGVAGEEAFEVVGFLVSRSTTNTVFSFMNVSQSSDKGIVVAALDKPDLSPAAGASALLEGSSEDAFIFNSMGMPTSGNTIEEGGSSFVFFPNVDVGSWSLEAFGAENTTCSAFPAGESTYTVAVEADAVSVVVFSCE